MANQQPYEITAGPVEVYIAPVGESMPAIGTEPPGGNWTLIGTIGDDETSEEGVSIQHTESLEVFRGLGSTAPMKVFRTAEDLIIGFSLADLTLEEYARKLNFNTVATDTDDKTLDMYKGDVVLYRALLIRGEDKGPYGASYNIQWEIPRVYASGDAEIVWVKGSPAMLAIQFTAAADLNASADSDRFGVIRTQFQN